MHYVFVSMLQVCKYSFSCMSPDIDEKAIRHPDPRQLPLCVARGKMEALKKRVTTPAIIITADQIVLYEGTVREKPEDKKQAHEFLSSYSNKSAQTVSAIVVHNTATEKTSDGVDVASVKFSGISGISSSVPPHAIWALLSQYI